MTGWGTVPPDIRAAALAVCTADEIDVLKLMANGYGYRKTARALSIDRDTARNRWERASRKIRDHLGTEDAA